MKGDLSKTQREYVLRKQLEAIRKELSDIGVEDDDVLAELRQKLEDAEMSEEAQKDFYRSMDGMAQKEIFNFVVNKLSQARILIEETAEGGEYLPLSVYASRGFDTARIALKCKDISHLEKMLIEFDILRGRIPNFDSGNGVEILRRVTKWRVWVY